jgi:hypothetical protein
VAFPEFPVRPEHPELLVTERNWLAPAAPVGDAAAPVGAQVAPVAAVDAAAAAEPPV